MKNINILSYDEVHEHINCEVELMDVWDWQTNREIGIQLVCKDCEGVEPLLEIEPAMISNKQAE